MFQFFKKLVDIPVGSNGARKVGGTQTGAAAPAIFFRRLTPATEGLSLAATKNPYCALKLLTDWRGTRKGWARVHAGDHSTISPFPQVGRQKIEVGRCGSVEC
jgi:hypothetical protein